MKKGNLENKYVADPIECLRCVLWNRRLDVKEKEKKIISQATLKKPH